jgi:hypothetical protein
MFFFFYKIRQSFAKLFFGQTQKIQADLAEQADHLGRG